MCDNETTQALLRRKSIEHLLREAGEQHGLRRVLGWASLVSLGIGAIIGAGIFVLTGKAAALYAGPAIVLSFIISGLCTFSVLVLFVWFLFFFLFSSSI